MSEGYDYIKRTYGASFFPRDRVEHTVTGRCGKVMRPKSSHLHYVRVHFGAGGAALCHPNELKIIARGPEWAPRHRAQEDGTDG